MEKLIIENFRNIKDRITIDMAKINILTGPNNSGKSNILKLLILLNDYLNSDNHFILSFNGINSSKHKIDCYQNAIHWQNWKKNKSFKVSFVKGIYEISFEFVPLSSSNKEDKSVEIQKGRLFCFEFINTRDNSKLSIKHNSKDDYTFFADHSIIADLWIGRDYDKNALATKSRLESKERMYIKFIEDSIIKTRNLKKSDKAFRKELEQILFYSGFLQSIKFKLTEYRTPKKYTPMSAPINMHFQYSNRKLKKLQIPIIIRVILDEYFNSEIIKNDSSSGGLNLGSEIINLIRRLEAFVNFKITHLNPDRANQSRIHLNSENTTEINRIISSFKINPFKNGGQADEFLTRWMKTLKIGNKYRFRDLEGIATVIEIKDEFGWHNLVDKGFGAGQIFSVLIRIAEYIEKKPPSPGRYYSAAPDFPTIIAIEEPEANLHPKFQSYLADIFYDATEKSNLQFIIETHSEYIIRRFQYLVAVNDNNLVNTNIKILYFQDPEQMTECTSQAYDLSIRADGMLTEDFGPGFFDEATRLTIDLLKKQN